MGQTDGWHRLAGGLNPQGLSLEVVTFWWPGVDTDPTSSPETGHLSVGSGGHLANPLMVDLVRLPDTFYGSPDGTLFLWAEE